ncbi:MAG TPA: enoyl-CoA hydratase-related protein [Polyangiaceae bacterium]|jgi:enoyl-CoA hydratase/carnithine racemase|nr:enoyl-CoA hydratase-related protein [Polyangiaceae bacterium]
MSDAVPLRVERRLGLAIVTLDRPDRMNAMSRMMLDELGRVGEELSTDDAIRAVIITGAGNQAFCAGADLKERRAMSEDEVREHLRVHREKLSWIEPFPSPVIAAINGVALGGGLELAMLCDLRVAAEHAIVGLPETSLGIIPGAGGTQRLPRIIGEARAKELILLGRRISAAHALAVGLVNRVSRPGANVLDDTIEWIRPIIEGAPLAQRAALAAIDVSAVLELEEGLEQEAALYDTCLSSEDRREALNAFADKRKPSFKGK